MVLPYEEPPWPDDEPWSEPRGNPRERFDDGANALPPSVSLDEVDDDPVAWRWDRWLPTAGLVLLEGGVGSGKSCIAADWCARETNGLAYPGRSGGGEQRAALWLTAEERLGRHVKGRLVAAEAAVKRVRAFPSLAGLDLTSGPGHAWLRGELERYRYSLVVLDSLKSFMGDCDENNDMAVRRALNPIVDVANEYECTVIGLRHWRKSAGLALERGGGSVAFVAMAEVVLSVGAKGTQRYVAQAKNRAAEIVRHSWPFDIHGEGASYRALWNAKPELVSANDLAMADVQTKAKLGKGTKGDRVREAIIDALERGPRPPGELVELVAQKVGCGERTVRDIARAMGFPDGRGVDEWRLEQ